MSNFKCATCGSELKTTHVSAEVDGSDDIRLYVELDPCDSCISAAYHEGASDVTGEG